MKIRHLKNQFRSFNLVSGKSLYLYPMADEVEISEQDFYLSKKFQRYVKEDKAVMIQEEEKSLGDALISGLKDALAYEKGELDLKTETVSLESKPKKSKKKKSVEE